MSSSSDLARGESAGSPRLKGESRRLLSNVDVPDTRVEHAFALILNYTHVVSDLFVE